MAKQACVVLKLKDRFSKSLKKAEENTKKFTKKQELAAKKVNKFGRTVNNTFKKAVKGTAAAVAGLSAIGAKTGFTEAVNLEGYKSQLETATKSTKKAAKIMKYSINLANKTPFEGGEIVEGAAKFESMGMSAKKWLTYAGDMAGATNKSFDQSVEALIDAQAGELERLKEFGITKRQIVDKAEKMFAGQQVVNNQGQIVNQKKFNKALLSLMNDKFAGGMEKQAQTLKGAWSTVTGVTKSALANVMGMTSDGTIRAGSALDIFKQKIGGVAKKLTQWQNDGTLDNLATKIGDTLGKALDKASDAVKWLKDNMYWLKPVLTAVVAGFIAFNIVSTVTSLITGLAKAIRVVQLAFTVLKGTMFSWQLLIGAIIAVIIWLVLNFKDVVKWVKKLKEKFMEAGGPIGAFRDGIFAVVDAFKGVVTWVGNAITKVKEFLGMDTKKTIEVTTIQSGASNSEKLAAWGARHATGTPYFAGGMTRFSESGRSEAAIFPSGTQIIPHDQVPKMGGGKSIVINYIVQGNMIGNREYMEQSGKYIAKKVMEALGNS